MIENWTLTADEALIAGKASWGEAADFTERKEPPIVRALVLRRLLLGLPVWPVEGKSPTTLAIPAGITVRGVVLDAPLDLADCGADSGLPPLILERCRLPSLDLRHAHLRRLVVKDCAYSRLNLDGSCIDGDVELSGSQPLHPDQPGNGGDCVVEARGVLIDGSLTLARASLRLTSRENLLEGERKQYALELSDSDLRGTLVLQPGFSADGGVRITNASITGDIRAAGADLKRGEEDALQAQNTSIGGSVHCRSLPQDGEIRPFRAVGTVWLMGAKIGGAVEFSGAHLDGLGGQALAARGIEVGGSLQLRCWENRAGLQSFCARGVVSISGAKIKGNLDCEGGEFDGQGSDALIAIGIEIGGGADLSIWNGKFGTRRFLSRGTVRFSGAKIGNYLSCIGADLNGQGRHALAAEGADIGGSLGLGVWHSNTESYRCTAHGTVSVMSARVANHVDCSGAEFDGCGGMAINASHIHVGGTLLLRGWNSGQNESSMRCSVLGELWLANAHAGRVECHDADLQAVVARELKVNDDLWFGASVAEYVIFDRISVGGRLDLSGLTFLSSESRLSVSSVSLADARIARSITITRQDRVDRPARGEDVQEVPRPDAVAVINLERARCASLDDQHGAGWGEKVVINIEGFVYGHLAGHSTEERQLDPTALQSFSEPPKPGKIWRRSKSIFKNVDVAATRIAWLSLQYSDRKPSRTTYRPQPYEQLARVLEAQGARDHARQVLRLKARIEAFYYPRSLRWLYTLGFGFLFGYGLSARRALATFAAFIFIGTGLVAMGRDLGLLVIDSQPSATYAIVDDAGAFVDTGTAIATAGKSVRANLPCTSEITNWVYAADLAIPLLDLHEETRCTIRAATPSDGQVLSSVSTFLRHPEVWRCGKGVYAILGWIISSLTALTVAGVFRRAAER